MSGDRAQYGAISQLSMSVLDRHCCVIQVVQGYKFNIFYPDLIDKLEAPTYSLEKDPGADEHGSTCMLRYGLPIVASQVHSILLSYVQQPVVMTDCCLAFRCCISIPIQQHPAIICAAADCEGTAWLYLQ